MKNTETNVKGQDEYILKIRDLNVIYDTDEGVVNALNGVDIDLKRGETLGLVGETGAGKTTMALSILKLLPDKIGIIKKGEILLEGEDIIGLGEEKMRHIRGNTVSMIFQDPMTSLNPVFKVGEQVADTFRYHDKSLSKHEIEKKVDEMFELVGLPHERKNEYPHQFSGGMKQRIVIAMALACQPKLLLADEPTTALDVTIQAQILKLMHSLKDRLGTSMILITHDLGIVAHNCDKVAVMYAGEIIESGSLKDIFKGDKHHPYTVGLFGSIPDLSSKAERLSPINGLMPDPSNLPKGCKFHPRCNSCKEICKTSVPETFKDGTHVIKCHKYTISNFNEMK